MNERLEMLQIASKAWLGLKKLAESIPDAALEQPNTIGIWSGRDMLGHLAGWEAIGIDIVNQLNERGEYTPLGVNRETIDAFNEEMLIPYRAMTTREVRQSLEDTHFALMQLAEASQADIADVVLDVTRDHYNKHLGDLRGIPRR
ncbi:MAG TPA: ClbS/DfsB family four-helix bundle protein [Thermomicrobiales bacterium]|nr:ClbS/DfsB family four-helix bundle protein [Thermomicrobiales bacterium]